MKSTRTVDSPGGNWCIYTTTRFRGSLEARRGNGEIRRKKRCLQRRVNANAAGTFDSVWQGELFCSFALKHYSLTLKIEAGLVLCETRVSLTQETWIFVKNNRERWRVFSHCQMRPTPKQCCMNFFPHGWINLNTISYPWLLSWTIANRGT